MTSPPVHPAHVLSAAPANLRRDERQRDIVDHAITVQEHSNTIVALEYLKSNDVSPGVIERVLLNPERRRIRPA